MSAFTKLQTDITALAAVGGGDLSFKQASLGLAALSLFDLLNSPAKFTNAIVGQVVGNAFTVSGRLQTFAGECAAELTVRSAGVDTLVFRLEARPTVSGWGFQDVFPNLPDSFGCEGVHFVINPSCFYDLTLSDPVLTVETGAEDTLAFRAGLALGKSFQTLTGMLPGGSGGLACTGQIDRTNSRILLDVPLPGLKFDLPGGAISNAVLHLNVTPATDEAPEESVALVRGETSLRSPQHPAIVEASILAQNFLWDFRVRFPEDAFPLVEGFQKLAAWGGLTAADLKLPDGVQSFNSFHLSEMGLGVNPVTKEIGHISFLIGSREFWHTPLPEVSVGGIQVGLYLAPGSTPHVSVAGQVVLGTGDGKFTLEVETELPDFDVHLSLPDEEEIDLRRVMLHFFGGYPFESNFTVERLDLFAAPGSDSYRAEVQIKDDWLIAGKITLSPLTLVMERRDGRISGSLAVQTLIGGMRFFARAEYPTGDAGWFFQGGSVTGTDIPIGQLLTKLGNHFGLEVPLPGALEGSTVQDVALSFDTGTREFHFGIELKFPLNDAGLMLDAVLNLDLTHQGSEYQKKFGGKVTLGGMEFDLVFQQGGGSLLVACLSGGGGPGATVTLADLLNAVGADGSSVPGDLSFTLKSALLAREVPALTAGGAGAAKASKDPWTVFGVDIDGGLNLSNLPLVGGILPPDLTLGVEFQALYSSLELGGGDVAKRIAPVNALLPSGAAPLPTGTADDPKTPAIAGGVSLGAKLHLGTQVIDLSLPISLGKKGIAAKRKGASAEDSGDSNLIPAGTTPSAPVTLGDDLKWFTIHKAFGPLHFERLGIGFEAQEPGAKSKGSRKVTLAVDASVEIGGLTLTLDGLGISSPLNKFEPEPRLRGIGIDYAGGPVEIGGSFLRRGEHDYSGTAVIKGQGFTLSAIGAYNDAVRDHPSLFLYAVLDYPLGGPSFFFVTGLAAGFGFNRSLLMPEIDGVADFPLVSQATHGAGLPAPDKVMDELAKLDRFLPADTGQYFLAVGLKFNSFKLIDSFALLAVSFGKRVEIDVLGLSTVVVPTPIPGRKAVEPLAKVTIALMARFLPDEGLLAVDARITPDSFILSRDCHITGGFAFHTWFKGPHAGDFVLSLGGYHPRFEVPAHYPKVPRLGFNWQVTPELVIKGGAYYALTSHALMTGCSLEAVYQSGKLKAWFRASADFLISWQPYHYDAALHIDVGGSYDTGIGTMTVDLGADLHIWGPDFAGTAELDLYVATVHVSFGDQTSRPAPIPWSEFKTAFLPDSGDGIVSMTVESGMVAAGDAAASHLGTVNPHTFSLATNSLIPADSLGPSSSGTSGIRLGVAPSGIARGALKSTHTVSVSRQDPADSTGTTTTDVTGDFQLEPVMKPLPAALWGEPPPANGPPPLNPADKFVHAITGARLTPRTPPAAHVSKVVASDSLAWDNRQVDGIRIGFAPTRLSSVHAPRTAGEDLIGGSILADEVITLRDTYLQAVGLDRMDLSLSALSDSVFTVPPIPAAVGLIPS